MMDFPRLLIDVDAASTSKLNLSGRNQEERRCGSGVIVSENYRNWRERGFDLKQIRQILYQDDFDIMRALEEHLLELEERREHMDALIQTVRQTILQVKGEGRMSDAERFEAFKERIVRENEEKYGEEIREKYGNDEIDEAQRRILNMSETDYERFKLYYDQEVSGCAKLLERAIRYWVDKI